MMRKRRRATHSLLAHGCMLVRALELPQSGRALYVSATCGFALGVAGRGESARIAGLLGTPTGRHSIFDQSLMG